jgi:tRNA pseudouridine38-40 synthase
VLNPVLWPELLGEFPAHELSFLENEPELSGSSRRMALLLAYEGSTFAGWQMQPGKRTIQEEVEKVLSTLCDESVRIEASGRTDAGVHAFGQVATFSTNSQLSLERMRRGLASLLPDDIYARELGPVRADFHARFDCQAKTYHYYLWPQANAAVFLSNRLWAVKQALDQEAMQKALAAIIGEHDLLAFASYLGQVEEGSTVRRILEAELDAGGPVWRVRLTGTGFLRHVVRNLVGTCVQIGMGRLEPEAVGEMLEARQRLYAGPKAPAGGLYLSKVFYSEPA